MFQRIEVSDEDRQQQRLLTERAEERAALQRMLAEAARNTALRNKTKNDDHTAH